MIEHEASRLVAWAEELRQVHARLRVALTLAQDAIREGRAAEDRSLDLLLYCHGFCVALSLHHRGEDRTLFPAIEAAHPDLAPVLRTLEQDHSMIAHLLEDLRAAVDRTAPPDVLERHLEGVAAIMENHFRYEERHLLPLLETMRLTLSVAEVLGPI